jgi:heme exporter protein A
VLEVRGLGKRFGKNWVFRGLDFQLDRGQSLVVVGRNGSGKSTLLAILAGVIGASEGTVGLPDPDRRLQLGYASLEMAIYPQLSTAEHLILAAKMRGCEPRTESLLDLVGLSYAADRQGSQLSTGMKSRLKLALAVQAEPPVLLLDEPGAAMDEQGRAVLERICETQRSRGVLLLATNDPAERRFGSHELELAG